MAKQNAPSGWMMRFELVFITNSPGAEDGTCPPAGGRVATRCMMRRGNSRGQALTATGSHSLPALQVPYLDKQKTIHLDGFLFMVRKTGLEPVRSNPHAPQTCASAGSATSACRYRQLILYYIFSSLSSGRLKIFQILSLRHMDKKRAKNPPNL